MVSKLEILQRFYQIYIDQESDYFTYQNNNYYFCRINNFTNNYSYYIHSLNLAGFTVVNNCFDRPITMDHILYIYQIEPYTLDMFIRRSMIPIPSTIEVIKIKESWCKILDEAKTEENENKPFYDGWKWYNWTIFIGIISILTIGLIALIVFICSL